MQRHGQRFIIVLLAFACLNMSFTVGQEIKPTTVLFENVRVFNGTATSLSAPCNVLIVGNIIQRISTDPIPVNRRADTLIIAGEGRTLMPGLIDAHVHTMMESVSLQAGMTAEISYVALVAGKAAERQLLRGFTSVRDMGGASFALKRAIDDGTIVGPRIYPSGATISQTSGHGDFRPLTELPRGPNETLTYLERTGMTAIADGVDQVLLRTRENLMRGASQIKLMAGGGVSSNYDPLDVTQYTLEELKAAVVSAENWGTYVTVHAYTPEAVKMAIQAGVKCIEHRQLLDEDTAKLMAEKKIWWSLQPFMNDEDANPQPEGSANRKKQLRVSEGTDIAYRLARQYNIRTAFGTDTLFDAKLANRQGKQLMKLIRWYTAAEVLKMATADNAELLALCGERNPYPGKLGVVEEGALADLLLVDGDPITNIELIANPTESFLVIMKDGKIFKNTLR